LLELNASDAPACPAHPERRTDRACSRCGGFRCAECFAAAPKWAREPFYCGDCAARHRSTGHLQEAIGLAFVGLVFPPFALPAIGLGIRELYRISTGRAPVTHRRHAWWALGFGLFSCLALPAFVWFVAVMPKLEQAKRDRKELDRIEQQRGEKGERRR
jgi:hypothetical protein